MSKHHKGDLAAVRSVLSGVPGAIAEDVLDNLVEAGWTPPERQPKTVWVPWEQAVGRKLARHSRATVHSAKVEMGAGRLRYRLSDTAAGVLETWTETGWPAGVRRAYPDRQGTPDFEVEVIASDD